MICTYCNDMYLLCSCLVFAFILISIRSNLEMEKLYFLTAEDLDALSRVGILIQKTADSVLSRAREIRKERENKGKERKTKEIKTHKN